VSAKRIFLQLISFLFIALVGLCLSVNPASAASCGMNIDPRNASGFPTAGSLGNDGWVRIEYRDGSANEDISESLSIYKHALKSYRDAGINTLLIVDYATYPNAKDNIDKFVDRVGKIDQELGKYVNAYEIWNEPDLAHMYPLTSSEFANIVNKIGAVVPQKKLVLGGFASGDPSYLEDALDEITVSYRAIGIHPYLKLINNKPPGIPGAIYGDKSGDMRTLITLYRNIDPSKQIWITEIGTDVSAVQADYLNLIYGEPSIQSSVAVIMWFAWSDNMVRGFGVLDSNHSPKASYDAYFSNCGGDPGEIEFQKPPETPPLPGVTPPPGQESTDYYLYPLKITDYYGGIKNLVVENGYEAQCAASDTKISMQALDALYSAVGGVSPFTVQLNDSIIPMYGNSSDLADSMKFNSSFQGYFEARTPSEEDKANLTYTGAAYANTSLTAQCKAKIQNFKSAEYMCQLLQDPTACALKQEIAGTNYYIYHEDADLSLLKQYEKYIDKKITCDVYALGYLEDMESTIDEQTFNDIRDAIFTAPLSLSNVYRIAYLVILPQRINAANYWFKALNNKNYTDNQTFDPIIFPIKIPDIATNKPLALDSIGYQDSSQIATGALHNFSVGRDLRVERTENLSDIQTIAASPKQQLIHCSSPYCAPTYEKGIYKILIDIINGYGESCQSEDLEDPKVKVELAGEIGTPTYLSQTKAFINPYLSEYELSSQSKLFSWGLNSMAVGANNIPVNIYLVSPFGTDLKIMEEAMSFILSNDTEEQAAENHSTDNKIPTTGIPDYYPIKNGTLNFYDVHVGADTKYKAMVKYENETSNYDFHVPGAKLGWLIKEIQKTGYSVGEETHEDLVKCERTEELFLGKCGGDASTGSRSHPGSEFDGEWANKTLAITYGRPLGGWGSLGAASSASQAISIAENFAAMADAWNGDKEAIVVVNPNLSAGSTGCSLSKLNSSFVNDLIQQAKAEGHYVMLDVQTAGCEPVSTMKGFIDQFLIEDNVFFDLDIEWVKYTGETIAASKINEMAEYYFQQRDKKGYTTPGLFAFYVFRYHQITSPSQLNNEYPGGWVIPINDGYGSCGAKIASTEKMVGLYGSPFGGMEFQTKWGTKYDQCPPADYFGAFPDMGVYASQ